MRWKKNSNFIIVVILSIAYTYVAFLNIMGPLHPPIISIKGPEDHPGFALIYWIIALAVTWSIYYFLRKRPGLFATLVLIIVGIAFIFAGIFLWDIAIRYENLIVPTHI